jgi:uncharacterized protein YdiU (UPF0061 family)
LTPLTSQRFGLRTYQDSDDRDVQDFLSLLRAHGADFHASLRELANFHPSKIDDDAYRRSFAKRWVANTTIDLKSDSAMRAEEGITAWLRTYAARATSADEKAAWEKDAPDGEWEEIAPSPCAPSTPALCPASGSQRKRSRRSTRPSRPRT